MSSWFNNLTILLINISFSCIFKPQNISVNIALFYDNAGTLDLLHMWANHWWDNSADMPMHFLQDRISAQVIKIKHQVHVALCLFRRTLCTGEPIIRFITIYTYYKCYRMILLITSVDSSTWVVKLLCFRLLYKIFSMSCDISTFQKMKLMASGSITSWHIDGEAMETVRGFIFLSSKITAHGDCSHEIKRHLFLEEKLWQT